MKPTEHDLSVTVARVIHHHGNAMEGSDQFDAVALLPRWEHLGTFHRREDAQACALQHAEYARDALALLEGDWQLGVEKEREKARLKAMGAQVS